MAAGKSRTGAVRICGESPGELRTVVVRKSGEVGPELLGVLGCTGSAGEGEWTPPSRDRLFPDPSRTSSSSRYGGSSEEER